MCFMFPSSVIILFVLPISQVFLCGIAKYMSKKGMKLLSHFGYLSGFSFMILNCVNIVFVVDRHRNRIDKEVTERTKGWH